MSIEIEKKYRLNKNQFEQIQTNLKNIEANFIDEDFEENILYSGGILNEKGAVLRVRKIDEKTILTFKQRISNEQEIKHQLEFETEVENAEQLEKIVESLGFEKSLIYEKRRKTWKMRNVEIFLDKLPFGLFMEIEGSISAIVEAEKLLNAEDFETEHQSYPFLTAKYGKRNGQVIEARIDD